MTIHGYDAYMAWEQEQLKSPWFGNLMATLFPNMDYALCNDPQKQKDGIDVLLTHKRPDQFAPWDRREFKLDAKFRRKHYDDFLVEIRHQGPTVNMMGWGMRGLACDYLLYITLETHAYTLMEWPAWWSWWIRNRHELSTQYPLKQAKNRSYTTYFVNLPWELFAADVPLVKGYTNDVAPVSTA